MIKKFFVRLLLIVVPIVSMVVVINYFTDPANLFSSQQYVGGISDILSRGHNVSNVSNYDERLLQEQMISKIDYRPDVVVLGSSRIMEIGSDFFPGMRVLNCGVSHANIEDVLGVMGILDSLGRMPKEILLNLDPFLICKGGTAEWETLSVYRNRFAKKLGMKTLSTGSNWQKKLFSLVSFDYFEKSLAFIAQHKNKHYSDVGTEKPVVYGRMADGTIAYPTSYTRPDTLKVAGDAKIVGAREQADLDPGRLALLDSLLDYCQRNGIGVSFVILPFHDQYVEAIRQHYPDMLSSYMRIYRDLATRFHISLYGDFDPSDLGIPRVQFYDAHHCSKEAIRKIFRNI